nr:thermonuclease family protein [Roseomonas marmotae]
MIGAAVSFAGLALVGLGLPTNLFGSAPAEQDWTVPAASVRVVDGDTLRLDDRVIRLSGLLSPERGQTCRTAQGAGFDCGAMAAQALARLVQGRDLTCHLRGRDRFGRATGICQTGDVTLNAALVSSGWALAENETLAPLEAAARQGGQGLWSNLSGAPEAWRQRR